MLSSFVFRITIFIIIGINGDQDCGKPPNKNDLKNCCTIPELVSPSIADKCKAFKEDSIANNLSPCYANCILNETGIFQKNQVNIEKAKLYLSQALGDKKDFQPVIEQAFTKCMERGTNIKDKINGQPLPPRKNPPVDGNTPPTSGVPAPAITVGGNAPPPTSPSVGPSSGNTQPSVGNTPPTNGNAPPTNGNGPPTNGIGPPTNGNGSKPPNGIAGSKCHPKSGAMFACVMSETFMNCPSSAWNKDPKCDSGRLYIKNCKPNFGQQLFKGPPKN